MIITYKKFKIEPQNNGFDLIKQYVSRKIGDGDRNNPTGEIYIKEDIIAYNASLDYCIKTIIQLEMKEKQETVTLKEFLQEFKKIQTEIENLLK